MKREESESKRRIVCVFCLNKRKKEKEERKEESKGMLGLLNARVKRVEGPDLHVQRTGSHELEKERRIPQNPLIKGRILREFDMSDGVKEGGEDGVDGFLQIPFVGFVGPVLGGIQTQHIPIHLISGNRDVVDKVLRGTLANKLDQRRSRKTEEDVEKVGSKRPKHCESSVERLHFINDGLISLADLQNDL